MLTDDDILLAALLADPRDALEPAPGEWGYALTRGDIRGRALLHTKLRGMELVKRLKNADGALAAEAAFWARQLAFAAREMVEGLRPEVVSHPPSSEKPGRTWHLATALAATVAAEFGLPSRPLFRNPTPRRSRGNMASKLHELTRYEYLEQPTGRIVLVVDDAYCTGSTAQRCLDAATGDRVLFLALCRS